MLNIKEFLGLGYYVSELDQFLGDYHRIHPSLSSSQRQEKDKYDRIFERRDSEKQLIPQQTFWDTF